MTTEDHSFSLFQADRLERIFNRLCTIPEGAAIVSFIAANNIVIGEPTNNHKKQDIQAVSGYTLSGIKDGKFSYGQMNIFFDPALDDDNILQSICHETTHFRHHLNNLGNPEFWPNDEDHCLLRRVQEADAQTQATKIAYLLKLTGDDGPFKAAANTGYNSMCEAFENACTNDPNALHNGRAERAAFDAWFSFKSRTEHYDRDTMLHQKTFLEARMLENRDHGLQPGTLTSQWLEQIGNMSKVNYMTLPGSLFVTADYYRANIKENLEYLRNNPPPPETPGQMDFVF